MSLKIQNLIVHDHTDPHVVVISKGVLVEKIYGASSTSRHISAALGWLGISIALGLAAFLTETFKSIGSITGDNIRSVAVMLSIVTLSLAIYSGWNWFTKRKTHTSEGILKELTTSNPLSIEDVGATLASIQNKTSRRNNRQSTDG